MSTDTKQDVLRRIKRQGLSLVFDNLSTITVRSWVTSERGTTLFF